MYSWDRKMHYADFALQIWILISLLRKDCLAFQRFEEQPTYTEVNPGHDALLICKVTDKRGTCSWQKDNKPVGIYPKKYEWAAGSALYVQGIQSMHIGGDCSLWIRAATLDFDDGLWECQVTASDFASQDALTSRPVRLVVRVAPQKPRLEYEGLHVHPGNNVTVDAKALATLKCVSHYGNPPALIKWYLGEQEILPMSQQSNLTEADNPKTWSATSVVQVPTAKDRNGQMIKCIAIHDSYAAKSMIVEARLNVNYPPSIRLIGAPHVELEEGRGSIILRCEADANPPAKIVWRRSGRGELASIEDTLQLRPVGRKDAGIYTCQAQNSMGASELLSVQLEVKYSPKILSAGPDSYTTVPLYSPAALECIAEGNPAPTYKWFQRIGSTIVERGQDSRMTINNTTYSYQGEYECQAKNYINDEEKTDKSQPIILKVVGAPQVLRLDPSKHTVIVRQGDTASLSLIVCADPRPHQVLWEWGSLRLEVGSNFERYRALDVTKSSQDDCYLATLQIVKVDMHDTRPYYLYADNGRGYDRHSINLKVDGPIEISYLLFLSIALSAVFIIFFCICIYALKAKKCCFKYRLNVKDQVKYSEKSDIELNSENVKKDSAYETATTLEQRSAGIQPSPKQKVYSQRSPEAMKLTPSDSYWWTSNDNLRQQHYNYSNADHLTDMATFTGRSPDNEIYLQKGANVIELGIPDVTTRVGNVIHAFESMAQQGISRTTSPIPGNNFNNKAEQPYEVMGSSVSLHRTKDSSPTSLNYPTISNYMSYGEVTGQTKPVPVQKNFAYINLSDDYRKNLIEKPQKRTRRNKSDGKTEHYSTNMAPINNNSAYDSERERIDETDFYRGTTISQSFVKNPKARPANTVKTASLGRMANRLRDPPLPPPPQQPKSGNSIVYPSAIDRQDELNERYKEYGSSPGDQIRQSKRKAFRPKDGNKACI